MKDINKCCIGLFGANAYYLMVLTVITFVASLQLGCSQLKAGKIIDGIEKATDVAEVVCSAAPLFSDRLPRGVEVCQKVLDTAAQLKDDKRVVAAVELAICVEEYREDKLKLKLVECVDAIDGAALLIAEIEK